MDWNVFFESPGYALVTNQTLELLDYKSIMVCREVSPIWKKYIDEQRIGRVSHLLSLMDKFGKINDKLFPHNYHIRKKPYSFGEKFHKWKQIIPYIKTENWGIGLRMFMTSIELTPGIGVHCSGLFTSEILSLSTL